MRDLSRFLNLYWDFMSQDGVAREQSIIHAFKICYLQRLSSAKQVAAIELVRNSGLILDGFDSKEVLQAAQVVRVNEQQGTLTFLNPLKPTEVQLSMLHTNS